MFEIIIDVTNRCFHQCLLCGTSADKTGKIFLDANIIEEIIRFAKIENISLYLGGGCFFCHPECFRILEYMKTTQDKQILIDVPPCKEITDVIQKYPMNKYCYNISTSLWGIENVHDNLSDSLSFKYVKQLGYLMKKNQDRAIFSFVITKQLIEQKKQVVNFISNFGIYDSFYFHRLMPTGRCREKDLPNLIDVKGFSEYVLEKALKPNIRFHHTIFEQSCTAYRNRLFIDWNGNVYGCGWVGENESFANIYYMSITNIMKEKEKQQGYKCPLLGSSRLLREKSEGGCKKSTDDF